MRLLIIEESSKPKVFRKASKQQQRDDQENRKLELFSEAVMAMKQPEKHKQQNISVENSEVAAFANYVRLSLSQLSQRKFRRAKKCIKIMIYYFR